MPAQELDLPAIQPAQARLILALVLSLACHLALIFLVKVLPPARPHTQVKVLQVALGERPVVAPTAPAATVHETDQSPARPTDADVVKLSAPPPDSSQLPANKPLPLPALEMPLVEDPTFYTARQVDVHPVAAEPIHPAFPDEAAESGIEGYVTLKLLIDDNGTVREVAVVEGNPPGVFENAALEAFRTAHFQPALRNGRVVKSQVLIRVTFELGKPGKP